MDYNQFVNDGQFSCNYNEPIHGSTPCCNMQSGFSCPDSTCCFAISCPSCMIRTNDNWECVTDLNCISAPRSIPRKLSDRSSKFADCPFDFEKSRTATAAWKNRKTSVKAKNFGRSAEDVEKFLLENPAFLKTFVSKHVDSKTLSKWGTAKKTSIGGDNQLNKQNELNKDKVENTSPSNGDDLQHINEEEGQQEVEASQPDDLKSNATPEEKLENTAEADEANDAEQVDQEQSNLNNPESESTQENADPSQENKITRSTSTTDAAILSYELVHTTRVTASTSTTDGLILTDSKNENYVNPKFTENFFRISKIREARARQSECLKIREEEARELAAKAERLARRKRGRRSRRRCHRKTHSESLKPTTGPCIPGGSDDDHGSWKCDISHFIKTKPAQVVRTNSASSICSTTSSGSLVTRRKFPSRSPPIIMDPRMNLIVKFHNNPKYCQFLDYQDCGDEEDEQDENDNAEPSKFYMVEPCSIISANKTIVN